MAICSPLSNQQATMVAEELAHLSVPLTEYADDVLEGRLPAKPEDVQNPQHPLSYPNIAMRSELATKLRDTARSKRKPFPGSVQTPLSDALFDCAWQVRLLIIETLFYTGDMSFMDAFEALRGQKIDVGTLGECSTEDQYLRVIFERFAPPALDINARVQCLQLFGGSIEMLCDLYDVCDAWKIIVRQEPNFESLCNADYRIRVQVIERDALEKVKGRQTTALLERSGFADLPSHIHVIYLQRGKPQSFTMFAPRRWVLTAKSFSLKYGYFRRALTGWMDIGGW